MGPLLYPGSCKTIGFLSLWYRFQTPPTIANFKGTLSREIVDLPARITLVDNHSPPAAGISPIEMTSFALH
jgi:hypothetical protein